MKELCGFFRVKLKYDSTFKSILLNIFFFFCNYFSLLWCTILPMFLIAPYSRSDCFHYFKAIKWCACECMCVCMRVYSFDSIAFPQEMKNVCVYFWNNSKIYKVTFMDVYCSFLLKYENKYFGWDSLQFRWMICRLLKKTKCEYE